MLINADNDIRRACADPILAMMATFDGRPASPRKVQEGIYEVGHFGSSDFLRGWNPYPNLGDQDAYGVCDDAANLVAALPALQDPARQFIATLTKVERDLSNRGRGGGWRWHKWGPYIGKHEPTTEYLDDEPDIEAVYVYHVYEKPVAP